MKSFVAGLLVICLCFGVLPALENVGQAAMPYYITVDVTNQIVTVYENGNRTRDGVVRQMICSTGAPGHSTPLGTFTLPPKSRRSERTEWYAFPAYNCYAKWATRIRGGYLFHSILYKRRGGSPTSTSLRALGSRASHGCVRLRPDDSKWIALNCAAGTQVRIYNSGKWDSALRKRLLQRSFYRGNESYYTFLGINTKIPLRYGSGGALVKKLQRRLKALGFFTGSIGGNFLTLTDDAVRAFKAAAGMKDTSIVSQTVWNRIFAEDAPTGTRVALSKGMSGPAVATLQKALRAVKCYSGEINGKYDDATYKAVRKWQKVRGYTIDGKASPLFQRRVLAKAKQLLEKYGDEPYKLVAVRKVAYRAKVRLSKAGIFKTLNTAGTKLKTLKKDTVVKLLAQGDGWLQVEYDGVTGFMRESSLTRCDKTTVTYRYMLASSAAPGAPDPLPAIPEPKPESNGEPVPAPEADETEPEPEAEPEQASETNPGAGLSLDDEANDVIEAPLTEAVPDGEIEADPQAVEAETAEVEEIEEAPAVAETAEAEPLPGEDVPAVEEAEVLE